jgi:hypothetical protein
MLPIYFSSHTLYIDDKNRPLLPRKIIILDILVIGENHGEPHAGEKLLP